MKILGFIPARGGSKGVPGKNILRLGDTELIGRAIQTAQESGCLDRLWISTDDAKTAEVAQRFGVEVPWLRPAELAQDNSALSDVLFHFLNRVKQDEGYEPDAIMILQPTSPFRKAQTIREAVELFSKHHGESVISVTAARSHPYWCYQIGTDKGTLKPFIRHEGPPPPRQKFPDAYTLDGSIYLISTHNFLKTKSFFSESDHPLIVPEDEALDIDTPFDWEIVQGLFNLREASKVNV